MVARLRVFILIFFWILSGCGQDDCIKIIEQFEVIKQHISDSTEEADSLESEIYLATEDDQISSLNDRRNKIVNYLNDSIDIANSIFDDYRLKCRLDNYNSLN